MNTFLPYKSFSHSAQVLDNKRLGKQRVEAYQIYLALTKKDYGWQNHPATKMWKHYELALAEYGLAMCEEWITRGFKDTLKEKFLNIIKLEKKKNKKQGEKEHFPVWINSRRLQLGYRSNLLRKDQKYYKKKGWRVPETIEYYWPV